MSQPHKKKHIGRIIVGVLVVALIAGAFYFVWQSPVAMSWVNDFFGAGEEKTLFDTTWSWKRTEFPNGTVIEGPGGDLFLLSFGLDGRVTSTTDCNSVFGEYSVRGIGMSIGELASTKIACSPTSLEWEYSRELSRTDSFDISGRELRLQLEDNTGVMLFSQRK
jgi:heat shock protein HslJ